jgi:membrane protease YdiL (CAAX protease family)
VHTLIVLFLLLIFPFWDLYEAKKARDSGTTRARIRWYIMCLVWPWIVTPILLFTVPTRQLFTPTIVWRLSNDVIPGLLVGIAIGAIAMFIVGRKRPLPPAIDFMRPRIARERMLWALVALSAGLTEEIIYRGFLIRYLQQWTGLTIAVVIAAVMFALDHIYQGPAGVLQAFFGGLLFTGLFAIAGSLWLPIAAHAFVDLRVLALPGAGLRP